MPVTLPLILDGERLALLCVRAGYETFFDRELRPQSLLNRVPASWTRELHVVTETESTLPSYYVRGKAGIPPYWFPLFRAGGDTSESLRCSVENWNTDLMSYLGVVPDEDFAAVMEMCS